VNAGGRRRRRKSDGEVTRKTDWQMNGGYKYVQQFVYMQWRGMWPKRRN
jgi:hypothetical protein